MEIKGRSIVSTGITMRFCALFLENDAKLFTPGPLTTSMTVKQAMLHDLGSRDTVFMNIVAHIRAKLLELAG